MKPIKLSDAVYSLSPHPMPRSMHKRLETSLGIQPRWKTIAQKAAAASALILVSVCIADAVREDLISIFSAALRHHGTAALLSAAFESLNPVLLFGLFSSAALYAAAQVTAPAPQGIRK